MNGWELNELWNKHPISFLRQIKDVDELIGFSEWRSQLPDKNMALTVETPTEARKLAIVILTPNLEDHYAVRTEQMIGGCPRIFATGTSQVFNEARYFNAGIEKALELNTDWIAILCDDLKEIDHFGLLLRHLHALDNSQVDTVWINAKPDYYHSYQCYLANPSAFEDHVRHMLGMQINLPYYRKFGIDKIVVPSKPIKKPFQYWLFHTLYPARMYRERLKFRMTSDICILSSEWCRKNTPVFDTMFIGNQDIDLSLRLKNARSASIDFTIGSEIGGHYKPSLEKSMREMFNLAILNEYIRKGKYP